MALAPTASCLATLSGHSGTVSSVVCSQERQQLFSGSLDGSIRIWGWPEGNFQQVGVIEVGAPVNAVLVEGAYLIAGIGKPNEPNVLRLWNMQSNAQQELQGHRGEIFCIAIGKDMLLSAGMDAVIRCWRMVRDSRRRSGEKSRAPLTSHRRLRPSRRIRPVGNLRSWARCRGTPAQSTVCKFHRTCCSAAPGTTP